MDKVCCTYCSGSKDLCICAWADLFMNNNIELVQSLIDQGQIKAYEGRLG